MIKRRTRIFSVIAGVVFIVLAAAAYVLFRAYDVIVAELCGTTVRRVIPAPSGSASAVIFERDCGATTSFSTQISIVPDGAAFSPERYPAFFAVEGDHDILLRWHGEGEIAIAIPRDERIYRNEDHAGGIAIDYE